MKNLTDIKLTSLCIFCQCRVYLFQYTSHCSVWAGGAEGNFYFSPMFSMAEIALAPTNRDRRLDYRPWSAFCLADLEESGGGNIIFNVTEAWKDSVHLLVWQGLLSCELLSISAVGIKHLYSNSLRPLTARMACRYSTLGCPCPLSAPASWCTFPRQPPTPSPTFSLSNVTFYCWSSIPSYDTKYRKIGVHSSVWWFSTGALRKGDFVPFFLTCCSTLHINR